MKILVADDEPISRHLLERFLRKWQYEVLVACDGSEAWQALEREDAPRLVILDWVMPGMDGAEICRKVRQQTDRPYTYILLLTGKSKKQDLVEGLEAGADDYLPKPFDKEELRVRLRAGRRILELQEQLIAGREGQKFQATHDALTGLWNRAGILEILEKEVARARRQSSPLSIVLADLDHFKRINDTYGHLAGDAVLREAAQRMRASVRSYDSVGRYGGEEFLIALPGSSTVNQAERIRASVGANPVDTPEAPITVTLSLGVAVWQEDGKATVDTLLRPADAALYRAKKAGRNRVELATAAEVLGEGGQEAERPNGLGGQSGMRGRGHSGVVPRTSRR